MERRTFYLKAHWRFAGLAGLCAVLVSAVMQLTLHAQAEAGASDESVVVGTVIHPTAQINVGKAVLRTPEEMAQAEATLGPTATLDVPFMPTDAPSDYQAVKAIAQAKAAVAGREAGALAPPPPGPLVPPTLRGVSFDGASQSGAFPPDTHGAVGLSHVVEVVNTSVVVFNKAGTLLKSTTLPAFFGSTEFIFDPRVVYDRDWRRWVIVASRKSTSATDAVRRFFLATSTTSDPTGAYFIYTVSFGGGPFNAGDWWDYPGLGMDQDAVMVTGNIFDTPAGGFKFAAMMPMAKARLYNGLGFSVPVFTGLAATLQPPIVLDQNKDAYFVAANNLTHLHLYRGENLSNAFEATLVLQALVDVPDYAIPPNAPQLGTSQLLDTLDRRFVNASLQVGDSLWNTHTINFVGFATPKFYQVDTEGTGVNTLKQNGFFFEGGTSHDFNASIVANTSGEAFVTWTTTDVANPTIALRHNARIRFSGRQPADALGSIPAGSTLVTSATALTGNPSTTPGVQRWGDYSAVSLDPSPGSTVGCTAQRRAWLVNEKINSSTVWGSRIARIGFCD